MLFHELAHIRHHSLIGEDLTMRRTSMVALVKGKDGERLGKGLAECPPVFQRTEQAMQNNQGMPLTITFVMQFHRHELRTTRYCGDQKAMCPSDSDCGEALSLASRT